VELAAPAADDPSPTATPPAMHPPGFGPWLIVAVGLLVALGGTALAVRYTLAPNNDPSASETAELREQLHAARKKEQEAATKLVESEAARQQAVAEYEKLSAQLKLAEQQAQEAALQVQTVKEQVATERKQLEAAQAEAKQVLDAAAKGDAPWPPGVVREIREGPNDKRLTIELPQGEYTLDRLMGNMKLKLVGNVRRLVVAGAEALTVLDAIELKAAEVRVTGSIAGSAKVKIFCPDGKVQLDRIMSKADVLIRAPQGRVVIGEVKGDAKLTITAKEVVLPQPIDGLGALVEAKLTRDGTLKFVELRGKTRLIWRKNDPDDPMPRIEAGRVAATASFRQGN
jgi:hypothetical protein